MSVEDLLIAITQVAAAIAGFSGLIAAIRTASHDGWHPRDIWSLSWMLGASIGALVLGGSAVAAAAAAAGWLPRSVIPVYVGCLIALLIASVLVLTIFLMLLARSTIRTNRT